MHLGEAGNAVVGLAQRDVQVARIEVVLAHEQDGKAVDGGEVHRLVQHAFLAGAVAEVAHADRERPIGEPAVGTRGVEPRGKAGADRHRNGRAHDRHRAVKPVLAAEEMHGPAHALGRTVASAQHLGDQGVEVAAHGKVVGMGAVRAEHAILVGEMGRDADSNRFLTDAKMAGRVRALVLGELADLVLGDADQQHLPQHVLQLLGRAPLDVERPSVRARIGQLTQRQLDLPAYLARPLLRERRFCGHDTSPSARTLSTMCRPPRCPLSSAMLLGTLASVKQPRPWLRRAPFG